MRRATLPWVAFAAILSACAWTVSGEDEDDEAAAIQARKEEVYRSCGGRDARWERMGTPRPDEWLARFPEPGQTPAEFRRRWAHKRKKGPGRIVIVPYGEFAHDRAALLADMRSYTEAFFDTPTEVAPPRPFPAGSWNDRREQHDAGVLLSDLAEDAPGDCIARVGFTDQDLWSGRLNFVFGVGSPQSRTGVYSIHRFRDPERTLERTLRLMNHEIGHILGIAHCIFYSCSMNGSNSLAESDRRPIHYCPADEEKLAWVLDSPSPARLRRLADWYEAHGLGPDAGFLKREAAEWEADRTSGEDQDPN